MCVWCDHRKVENHELALEKSRACVCWLGGMRVHAWLTLTLITRRCTAPQDESESEGPPLPPHTALHRHRSCLLVVGPSRTSTLHRWTSTGNGALLLASLPLPWRAAGSNIQSLRALAISTWLSACGALLLMRELTANSTKLDETTCTLRHNAWREACDATFRCNSRTYLGDGLRLLYWRRHRCKSPLWSLGAAENSCCKEGGPQGLSALGGGTARGRIG